MNDILEDVLKPSLNVVFCGTAASKKSAANKTYYAGPGNKFWKVLNKTGLTPREFLPEEYTDLLNYDIGLTDIAKKVYGNDDEIKKEDYDIESVIKKIKKYQPKIICFNGKTAGKMFFNLKSVNYGLQLQRFQDSKIFIVPSTSGNANGHWDIAFWHDLSKLIKVEQLGQH